ncbi:MAG: dynamin family protein [Lachnospiraceae bacterium]|nr:dynamin family protein [Lachnospiraceae bacterium]
MDIASYNKQIAELNTKIEQTREYALMLDDELTAEKLIQLTKMIRDDRFQLIVVGEFSRGKSMLVNAIIGKKVLPSSKNPTTATLNIIEDGNDQPSYDVYYHDGTKKELTEEEFLQLIAPEGRDIKATDINKYYNESNKLQQIHHIGIKISNRMSKNGITIIDTPGVNDVDERREQITYKYIPNADAALIICSSTQQLSMSEMVFIKENILKNDIDKIFVLSNFKDMLSGEDECIRVKDHFVKNLAGIVPTDRIILVSARDALKYKRSQNGESVKNPPNSLEETGFVEFENKLYDFLINERGAIKINRYKKILKRCAEDLAYGPIDRRLKALQLTTKEIELKIQTLRPEIQQMKTRCENRLVDIQSKLLLEGKAFSKEYRRLQENIYSKAKDSVFRCESDVPEEIFAYMEQAIDLDEKELYVEFPERMRDKMIEIMKESLEKMGEEFGTVDVQIDFGFDDLNNNMKDQYNNAILSDEINRQMNSSVEVSTGEAVGAAISVAAGVIGVAAILSVGGLALPFAHLGLKIASEMGEKIGNSIDGIADPSRGRKQMDRILFAEIDKRFKYPIASNVENFEKQYKTNVDRSIENIKKECYAKLEQAINELNRQLNDKVSEAEERVEEKRRLMDTKEKLLAL